MMLRRNIIIIIIIIRVYRTARLRCRSQTRSGHGVLLYFNYYYIILGTAAFRVTVLSARCLIFNA